MSFLSRYQSAKT